MLCLPFKPTNQHKMKTLIDKETTIKIGDELMKYSDLLKLCLETASSQGTNVGDMRMRIKLLDKLEKIEDGKMIFEDTEFDRIKSIYASFTWRIVHKDLVNLEDELNKTT